MITLAFAVAALVFAAIELRRSKLESLPAWGVGLLAAGLIVAYWPAR